MSYPPIRSLSHDELVRANPDFPSEGFAESAKAQASQYGTGRHEANAQPEGELRVRDSHPRRRDPGHDEDDHETDGLAGHDDVQRSPVSRRLAAQARSRGSPNAPVLAEQGPHTDSPEDAD